MVFPGPELMLLSVHYICVGFSGLSGFLLLHECTMCVHGETHPMCIFASCFAFLGRAPGSPQRKINSTFLHYNFTFNRGIMVLF